MKKKLIGQRFLVSGLCLCLAGCSLWGCGTSSGTGSGNDAGSASGSVSDGTSEGSSEILSDGTYSVCVSLTGGSGKATVESPCRVTVKDGHAIASITWSSSYYDYMIVDDTKYLPVNTEGNSVFEIPVTAFDEPMDVVADTTAMSTPHEIEYTLTFSLDDTGKAETESASASGEGTDSSSSGTGEELTEEENGSGESIKSAADLTPLAFDNLSYVSSMELSFATRFAVDYYNDGYTCIRIIDDGDYLLVPDGKTVPENLPESVTVIEGEPENIYLVASSVMDMFVSMDALDHVAFCALDQDAWYIDQAKEAMENGSVKYAGKYSAPDYEQIVAGGCDLAIENTMVYHTPEVQEQLEKFGIPVMVDHSSYESNPLGRCEWVKLYGVLTGREEQAEEAFAEQEAAFEKISDEEQTGKTVAFFSISTTGEATVRTSSDYLAKMINMAGGTYIFSDLGDSENTSKSTMNLSMEEFYAKAKDADYIIYNSTIEGELNSVNELLKKSSLLSNFKAVKEGHVYCTSKNMYQSTMELGTIISDMNLMLKDDDAGLTYLYHLQ